MENHLKIKITNEQTGASEVLTLDLRHPIAEQMRADAATEGRNYLHFVASREHDYDTTSLHEIVRAVVATFGASLIWELTRGETRDDIQAYLTLNQLCDNTV